MITEQCFYKRNWTLWDTIIDMTYSEISSVMFLFKPQLHFCAAPHKYWVFSIFYRKYGDDFRQIVFAPQKGSPVL